MAITINTVKQSNCVGKQVYKLTLPKCITRDLLEKLATYGYTNPDRYTKSGLLHLTNNDIILTGSFTNKVLSVYFKDQLSEEEQESKVLTITSMLDDIL